MVVLVAQGDVTYAEPFGVLTIGGDPVQRNSLYRISSVTKPITSAAALALIGEGLLTFDEPVDRLLPEIANRRVLRRMDGPLDDTVPAGRAITTRDLLTYTCGFGMVAEMFEAETPRPVVRAADDVQLGTFGPPAPAIQPDPDTWIAGFGSLPLLAQPGERWMYNTSGSVLGVLLARAADQPYPDVLRTRVFEPLGMRDTAFWTNEPRRLATVYAATPDGLTVWDEPGGAWSRPPAFADGAAGLLSTADDLLRFAQMLLRGGKPVLDGETVAAMTRGQLTAERLAFGGLGPDFFAEMSWGYGLGVASNGSYGWDGGLGTSWLVDPRHDLTVIVSSQRMFDTSEPPAVHREIQAAAYAAVG